MVVAFKRKEWKNDTYKPDDGDKYDDDETYNPKRKDDGRIEFKMKNKEKKDRSDTDCEKVKLYLTLTNLLNPNRPQAQTSRVLEAAGDKSFATLTFGASETGAPDSGIQMSFTIILSAILMASVLAF